MIFTLKEFPKFLGIFDSFKVFLPRRRFHLKPYAIIVHDNLFRHLNHIVDNTNLSITSRPAFNFMGSAFKIVAPF